MLSGNDPSHLIALAWRVIFLCGLPVVISAAVAGLLMAALQAATTVRDGALSYAARLGAVVLVTYFLSSSFIRLFVMLGEEAWRP